MQHDGKRIDGGRILKLNEFKKKLSSYGFSVAESVGGLLTIYLGKYPLITFNQRSSMFTDVKLNLNTIQVIDIKGLYTLLEITKEYVDTPIKERFPEKKYRLRWIDDSDCSKNYIGLHRPTVNYPIIDWYITSTTDNKLNNYQELWTESELEKLKKDNPRLAPAIDAMKEPAEDKDE